jgi:radical SAM protein with 4Fe4S-binding SPASM domain
MISNTYRFLSSISLKRGINLLQNEVSYYLSLLSNKPRLAGLPWAISIEPTTSCNLRCPECPSGLRKFTRPTGSMSLESYKHIIDQLSPHLVYLTLYFQGEPMLNSHFIEMVRYAKQKRIYVSTSTNGHFLDDASAKSIIESGLDRFIISFDGMDQVTYEKYRIGGDLAKVQTGIANLVKWKKALRTRHPLIELQFLVLGTNEHQLPEIKRYARILKVDKLTLKSAQLYNKKNNPLQTSIQKYSRYIETDGGELKIKGVPSNHCHRMWHSPVITWDGKILPCCFDKDADNILGDLAKDSFKIIWTNPGYKEFRKKVFYSRNEIGICTNCSEGLKKYL